MTTQGGNRQGARGRGGIDALATVGEWLAWAERAYEREQVALGQVATNAHDEALYLLLRTLGLSLESDARVLKRKVNAAERAKLEDVFEKRIRERVPAAYLTKEAWLGEFRFYVDERVIIPRSYFLEIIPRLAAGSGDSALQRNKVGRVVDVCTGSGCLAVLLAKWFPRARVDAIDLSREALDVARINVREHGLEQRVQLWESDVFDAVPEAKYDVILSNPPYEPSAHVDAQDPEFAAEPRMAHDGGVDGMAIVRKLLSQARERLAPGGIVVVEVGGLRRAIDKEFAALKPEWLATQDGSDCVFLVREERMRRGGRE